MVSWLLPTSRMFLRESWMCVHANQNAVKAERAGSRIDIRKQSDNSVFGKLDEDPRSVHRYAVSARPLAENNVTGSDDGAADDAALRFQRGVCQISQRYGARQIEVPRLDEHRRRYEDGHAVGSDRSSGAVVGLDLPFEFDNQQGGIARRRYVYGKCVPSCNTNQRSCLTMNMAVALGRWACLSS